LDSDLIDTQHTLRPAKPFVTFVLCFMFAALRPTRLRVFGWVAGGFAAVVAFRAAQNDRPSQLEHGDSVISELDIASQETTGKIWFGEEESSPSTNR
jgi:hypothetical protein